MTDLYGESDPTRADELRSGDMNEFEAEFAAPGGASGPLRQPVGRDLATVSVVVPTMNEALNLPYVAARMPAVDEIIVVDGNSIDGTVEVARELWPSATIVEQTRSGKGNALACGFLAATCDIVVMIDADGSTDPGEIQDFVDVLLDGADLAKGSRFSHGGDSEDITALRRLGNKALNSLVNLIFRAEYSDLCYGYNAFWRENLPVLDLADVTAAEAQWGDGFEIETIINVRMIRAGKKIREVGSFESRRIHGRSNLNAVSDGLRVLRTINKERRLQRAAR